MFFTGCGAGRAAGRGRFWLLRGARQTGLNKGNKRVVAVMNSAKCSVWAKSALGFGAALAAMVVVPTVASANNAANADISAPLRAARSAAAPDTGDQQFAQVFTAWRSAEAGVSAPVLSSVSIPSRAPLDGLRLTSDFGMRHHPVLGGMRMHAGLDLASPIGSPVYATADGVVGKAEWFGGYGLFIQIAHGAALETRYGHMSRLNVAAGQFVHKGDLIGFVGTTGRSTGPHLHYEVRLDGMAVNPAPYMQNDSQAQLAVVDKPLSGQ